jgi:DNA-binding MarR family transcriptional regulator
MSRPRPKNSISIRSDDYHGTPVYATLAEVRAVWALVSDNPTATIRYMQCALGLSRPKVFHILKFLESAGYICRDIRQRKAVSVIIPLVYLNGTTPPKQPLTEAEAG